MRTTDLTVVPKFIATANPLVPGSWWIRNDLVTEALPNRIFTCDFFGAHHAVCVESTLRDNPYLNNPRTDALTPLALLISHRSIGA